MSGPSTLLARASLKIAPDPGPQALAIARMATGIAAIFSLQIAWNPVLGTVPRELWNAPINTQWAVDIVPVTPVVVTTAAVVFTIASISTLLGILGRLSPGVATVAFLYIGWVHQLSGKTDHYHHVLWFLLILAVSPSTDRLSIDSFVRRMRGIDAPIRSDAHYSLPIAAMMLLIGVIYLFAGIGKLRGVGLEWVFSDNLQNIMYQTWWRKGLDPVPLVDSPLLSRTMAGAAVIFELGFLPAILFRPTRFFAAALGLIFHTGTAIILGISFITLQVMYVVFFRWSWLTDNKSGRPATGMPSPSPIASFIPAALVIGAAIYGALGILRAWPLAAYPTFGGIAPPLVAELVVTNETGSSVYLADSAMAEQFKPPHVYAMMRKALFMAERGDQSGLEAFVFRFEAAQGAEFGSISSIDQVVVRVSKTDGVVESARRVFDR